MIEGLATTRVWLYGDGKTPNRGVLVLRTELKRKNSNVQYPPLPGSAVVVFVGCSGLQPACTR